MTGDATAAEVFQRWLAMQIAPWLKALGWKRHGRWFAREVDGNTAFVQFRRDVSTGDRYRFTIRLAIYSPRVAEVRRAVLHIPVPRRPAPDDAVFDQPLGWLMGEQIDAAWTVRSPTTTLMLDALGDNVRASLERHGLPWLQAHASDQALRDYLLGTLELQDRLGLEELHALVSELGPTDRLPEIEALMLTADERAAERRANALADYRLRERMEVDAANEALLGQDGC